MYLCWWNFLIQVLDSQLERTRIFQRETAGSVKIKTKGQYKNRIMQSCNCDDSMLGYVIVERTSSWFVHSVTDKMLRVASPYRSIARFAKHVPCLTESFHENVNAGGRRSAFCFRKAFDSVGDHYTSRVHVSSAASFHPVNAYVGQCFPSGVQGRRQPKFFLQRLLIEEFNFRCCWDKQEEYEEAIWDTHLYFVTLTVEFYVLNLLFLLNFL